MRDNEVAGLAMVLARDCKMKVTVNGQGSYISPDKSHINIARMPATPVGRLLMTGLVFHEIGHKNHTTVNKPAGIVGTLTNILEDVRTELLTIADRPGTRFNLSAVTKHYIDKGDLEPDDLQHAICGKVMAYGRGEILKQDSILKLIPVCDEMIDDAFGEAFVKEIQDIIKHIPKLRDTKDTINMAQKIADAIKHQKTANPPPTSNSASSVQAAPGNGSGGKAGNGAGAGGGGEEGEEEEQQSGKPTNADIDAMLNEESDFGDISKMIQDDLNAIAAQASQQQVGQIPLLPSMSKLKSSNTRLNEVDAISASSKMRAKIMGMLQSIQRKPLSYGTSGKKIHPGRLEKMAIGDARIFKKKIEVHATNTAVCVLLDMSGSMQDNEGISNPAAFAVHHTLFGLKGASVCSMMFRDLQQRGKNVVDVICDFDEKPTSDKFNIRANGGTPTDQAIWAARASLLARKEPRKIILVVTDGCPDHGGNCAAATQATMKQGIEMAAIGIDNTSVNHYWKNSQVITDIKELPNAMLTIMENLLIDKSKGLTR